MEAGNKLEELVKHREAFARGKRGPQAAVGGGSLPAQ